MGEQRSQIEFSTAMMRQRLRENPEMQDEAIICHYARHAKLACNLLGMLECSRGTSMRGEADRLINVFAKLIRKDHATELGIPLEWPAPETQERG